MVLFDIFFYFLISLFLISLLLKIFFRLWLLIPILLFTFTLLSYLFRSTLPEVLEVPINTFYITHHNNAKKLHSKRNESREFSPFIADSVVSEGMNEGTKKENNLYIKMEGVFITPKSITKIFYFDLTWAEATLLIDKKEIATIGSTKKEVPYTFSPGIHHVEVFIRNTMTSVAIVHAGIMENKPPQLTKAELKEKLLQSVKNRDINLNYLYEFKDSTLYFQESQKESILFLSSFKPARYTIKNPNAAKLKAIVYSGVGVRFDNPQDIPIYEVASIPNAYKVYPNIEQCSSSLSSLICPDEKNFLELNQWVEEFFHKSLTGFSSATKPELPVLIPETILDDGMYKKVQEVDHAIKTKREHLQRSSKDPFYLYENERWKNILHVKESEIPSQSFRAFYLDKNDISQIRASEVVQNISMEYSHKPFHGIKADNFVSLWIGNFDFYKEQIRTINISISWAHIRLYDNDVLIYEGSNSTEFVHTFTKGKHTLEVEYINNYGQVDINIGFLKPLQQLDASIMQKLMQNQPKIYLFGSYESRKDDHGVTLYLEDSATPTLLFLSSYETINYSIKNAKGAKLQAVIANAYEPLGTIQSDAEVELFEEKRLPYTSRLIPFSYKPHSNHYENKLAFVNTIAFIEKLTGKKPDGFSSIEVPSLSEKRLTRLDEKNPIIVPQIQLDAMMYMKIENTLKYLDTH